MADILGGFSGFAGMSSIITYAIWILVFLLIAVCITVVVVMVMIKKNTKKIIEVNMQTKRLRFFNGRMKKKKGGINKFWAGKIKRSLPDFPQKTIYTKKNQDTVILLKDNNGLYHTARVPTYNELKVWYDAVYGIDLETNPKHEKLRNVFLLPTPHEDLDWLANQCLEAEKEFSADHWWQSPVIAYIGVGFICFIMFVATMILSKKM